MFRTWRIGSVLGFPIEISMTFLFLLGVVFIGFGGMIGVFLAGLAFASILLHELGHAVVSRRLGVPVSGIELNFFGGAAKMTDLPRSATDEIKIAGAGPAVSIVLAALGFGLGAVTGVWMITLIGWMNVLIAAFNLIPALPMDGGRILRALLTRKFDYVRATDTAVQISRVFAVIFAIYGISAGSFQLVILAPLLWVMGTREKMLARAMAHRYGYDKNGYNDRGFEVLFWRGGPHRPWWSD
jgi:Zn-dependent protease